MNVLDRLEEWCDGGDRSLSVRAYCEDWLGWRCDRLVGQARHDTAATILWQVTAEYCQAPTQDWLMRLEKVLSIESPLETNLIRMMGRARPNGSVQSTLSLFLAQLWIARLAGICVGLANGQSQDVRCDIEAIEYYGREAITELLHVGGSDLTCPEVDNFSDDIDDCESAWKPVEVYLRRLRETLASRSDAQQILAAMVQLESSVAWLLGLRAANQDSSSGRVLFVGEYADKKIGTLANLDVVSYETTVQLESDSILIPDLVYQGLTSMDNTWKDHFQMAAEWADDCAKSKGSDNSGPHVALYRLDFAFGDKTNTKGGGNRSSHISGPSASLAAGVLCRSQWTGIDVDSRCGYIGAIGREFKAAQNGVPFGFVPVRGLFTKGDTFDRHDPIGTLIVGELSKEDAQAADRWEAFADARDKDKVKQIDNLEQAFEIASGQAMALQVYAKTELNLVMRKLGAFMPKRLSNVMNRSFGQTIEAADFDVLDQMNMPQDATRPKPGAKARKPHAQVTPDEDEIAELQKVNLDAVLLEFLDDNTRSIEPRSSKCCKIVGGPGMGKTWVGLRFHLRLLRNYFLATGNQGTQVSLFPVWTTFHELQTVLMEHDDRSATHILGKIVSRRMQAYVASNTKFKDIAEVERVIQYSIERHLENKTLVLFVDAWDERNQERAAESTVTDWLESWFVNDNPGIMTSRRLGESTISDDPMSPIQSHRQPWTLRTEKGEPGFIDFARRWFGDDFDAFHEPLEQIAESLELSELTSVPQIAAIVCWLLENGSLEIVPARRSELLMLAMEKILAKNNDRPNHDPDHINFVKAVKQGIVLPVLQELAFNTFDSERWELTLQKFRDAIIDLDEGGSRSMRLVRDIGMNSTSFSKLVTECGLFVRTTGGRFAIVHQSFAELLVARQLLKREPNPVATCYEKAEEFALRYGLFDGRWFNVHEFYFELLPDASSILELLCVLEETLLSRGFDAAAPTAIQSRLIACLAKAQTFSVNEGRRARLHSIFDCCLMTPAQLDPYPQETSFLMNGLGGSRVRIAENLVNNLGFLDAPMLKRHGDKQILSEIYLSYSTGRISGAQFVSKYIHYASTDHTELWPYTHEDFVAVSFLLYARLVAPNASRKYFQLNPKTNKPHSLIDTPSNRIFKFRIAFEEFYSRFTTAKMISAEDHRHNDLESFGSSGTLFTEYLWDVYLLVKFGSEICSTSSQNKFFRDAVEMLNVLMEALSIELDFNVSMPKVSASLPSTIRENCQKWATYAAEEMLENTDAARIVKEIADDWRSSNQPHSGWFTEARANLFLNLHHFFIVRSFGEDEREQQLDIIKGPPDDWGEGWDWVDECVETSLQQVATKSSGSSPPPELDIERIEAILIRELIKRTCWKANEHWAPYSSVPIVDDGLVARWEQVRLSPSTYGPETRSTWGLNVLGTHVREEFSAQPDIKAIGEALEEFDLSPGDGLHIPMNFGMSPIDRLPRTLPVMERIVGVTEWFSKYSRFELTAFGNSLSGWPINRSSYYEEDYESIRHHDGLSETIFSFASKIARELGFAFLSPQHYAKLPNGPMGNFCDEALEIMEIDPNSIDDAIGMSELAKFFESAVLASRLLREKFNVEPFLAEDF